MHHANDNHHDLRFLSVCSGIEAASRAWMQLGWQAIAFSEIEKFPSAVLGHHYPNVPNLGDFTKIDVTTLGRIDILCGGKPGQGYPAVLTSAVRRLTPTECERLQGFPDGYTRIPMRSYKARRITRTRPEDMWEKIDGVWWLMAADGPRYKALGNSWAVPKFSWLGRRIQRFMPANDNVPELDLAMRRTAL
ncbi:DNA cytosine methyltransferase [Rhizobium sp. SG741]|uniref:DNA cytosine methyltransferase n=1 Tax=Rhizobium sp. SG741 TaxID=2587114 RepID=UPI00183139F6|nr:DNA cytosine methyltransferase [Rhizobium sp. SG741]NKJ03118.1 site-specific DNA-cytosine methylase [Rhizobium sp. SG741]